MSIYLQLMHCLRAKHVRVFLAVVGPREWEGCLLPCEKEWYNRHWVDVELLRVNYGLQRKPYLESREKLP